MEMDFKTMKKFWKSVITERVTSDRVVCPLPCFVFGFHIEATAGGTVIDAHAYDGFDANAEEKVTFTSQYAQPDCHPVVPMYFSRGLYLHLETNVASITVQYMLTEAEV